MSSMLLLVTDECHDAIRWVHSTAFCLTAVAPSSSPNLRSRSSHFLKKDLHFDNELDLSARVVDIHALCLVTGHFECQNPVKDVPDNVCQYIHIAIKSLTDLRLCKSPWAASISV